MHFFKPEKSDMFGAVIIILLVVGTFAVAIVSSSTKYKAMPVKTPTCPIPEVVCKCYPNIGPVEAPERKP